MGLGIMRLTALRWHMNLSALKSPVNFTPAPPEPRVKLSMLPVLAAAAFLCSGASAVAAAQHFEKHFAVKTRPWL